MAVRQSFHGEGGQTFDVAEHQAGLPEGPHQVLALWQVHGGLPAHRGVHLGQEGRGKLDEVHAAQVGGGGEPGQVSHHAPSQGNDQVRAGDPQFRQEGEQLHVGLHALALLAGGNHKFLHPVTRLLQRVDHRGGIDHVHKAVCHQHGQTGPVNLGNEAAALSQQSGADVYVVGGGCSDFHSPHEECLLTYLSCRSPHRGGWR